MAYFIKNNTKLYYDYFSSNENREVVVLIHGLGLNSTVWGELTPLLTKEYDIVCYDVRGHGKSERGTEELSWELLVKDLLDLLNSLKIDNFHIVSNGIGSYIGLQLSLSGSKRLQTLTLISSSVYFPKEIAERMAQVRRNLTQNQSMAALSRHMVDNIYYKADPAGIKLLLDAFQKVSIEVYFEYVNISIPNYALEKAQQIYTPTLALAGEYDRTFTPNLIYLSTQSLQSHRYLIVPNASNQAHMDAPTIVNEWICDFIRDFNLGVFNREKHVTNEWFFEIQNTVQKIIDIGYQEVEMKAPHLEINLLNGFEVFWNGREIEGKWNQRYAKRLLAYLVVHRKVTREQLYDEFWGDLDINRARNQLRVSLHHLKNLFQICEVNPLDIDREQITLSRNVVSDLYKFLDLVNVAFKEVRMEKKIAHIQEIMNQLPQPIFKGFYDNWIISLREKIEDHITELLEILIVYYQKDNQMDKISYYTSLKEEYEYG